MRSLAPTNRVVRRLATGGMAELIVVAYPGDERAGPFRVVKQILPHLRADPACQTLFILEGQVGLRLCHPNIVRTLAVGTDAVGRPGDGARPYILLEYLDGVDLSRVMRAQSARGERMSLAATFGLGIGLADGLAHAHAGGVAARSAGTAPAIVHRDVTPSNIMVTRAGEVKLVDFGVASVGASDGAAQGCIKGKLAYMSPEQVTDAPMDGRTDQFSLALVLWECLAGEPCFLTGDHFATLAAVVRGETRPIDGLRGDVPAALARALARALSPRASDRFAAIDELAHALRAAAADAGITPSIEPRWVAGFAAGSSRVPGADTRGHAPTTLLLLAPGAVGRAPASAQAARG